jgi:chromosome segregation ATPase
MFEGIRRDAVEVRRSVLELGLRAGDLHRHIEANLPHTLEDRLEGLQARLAEADNDEARAETERSIEALEPRLERREQLLERLAEYRTTIRSLQATAEDLANRAEDLATRDEVEYDYDEQSPERKISEMKASVAALEEVMRRDTNVIQ